MSSADAEHALLQAAWLGRVRYEPALTLQRQLHGRRVVAEIPDTVLLLEHGHVITLGRRSVPADVLAPRETLDRLGVDVFETDRGGQTTYHGPGQLVGYPIIDLKVAGLGPVTYVRLLERSLVSVLAGTGVRAYAIEGETGVWTDSGKIAAIGVRVSRGVTMHGFALNVTTDLARFRHIVPCGASSASVASIASETGRSPALAEVAAAFADRFARELGRTVVRVAPEAMAAAGGGGKVSPGDSIANGLSEEHAHAPGVQLHGSGRRG